MSDISAFTHKFRASKSGLQEYSRAKVIKRPRESLVCDQCRKSKLRCDRGHPCSSCTRRDEGPSCSYLRSSSSKDEHARHSAAEDRLVHLESLIKQLMSSQAPVPKQNDIPSVRSMTPPTQPQDVQKDERHDHEESLGSQEYVGSTHWSALLDDIQELKVYLSETADNQGTMDCGVAETRTLGAELIFGSPSDYSLQQIISRSLPAKVECDRLLSIYFQGEVFICPFIHTHQFQRQYREFWADPANTNPLWLSKLFSMCYTASVIRERNKTFHSSQNEMSLGDSTLHTAAAQCLVLGEYYRPQQLAIEALGLYASSKNLRTLDPCREAGALLGIIVRMAFELGYHRDPDSFGSFTAFEGEMRRRLWAALTQLDLMISFMLGLPSNICLENCDTKPPRNLLDSDFDVDTKTLPESRSEHEATRLLWFIVKSRQMPNFSKASKDALSFTEKSPDEVNALDQDIRQMYTTIPDVLRTRPLSDSFTDEPHLIMTRLYVELIYLKSLCVLHRKYMVRGNLFSTQCCVAAGKQIVSKFIEMYKEISPGGQLCKERWMLSNFTVNDVLLGIMVLCLALHISRTQRHTPTSFSNESEAVQGPALIVDGTTEAEVLILLEQMYAILLEKSHASRDIRRVSHVLRFTLRNTPVSGFLSSPQGSSAASSGVEYRPSRLSEFVSDPVCIPIDLDRAVQDLDRVRLAPASAQGGQESLQARALAQASISPDGMSSDPPLFGALDPFNFMTDIGNTDWTSLDPNIELFALPYEGSFAE